MVIQLEIPQKNLEIPLIEDFKMIALWARVKMYMLKSLYMF